ncbi:MFS transporter [Prescottella equi]|uniref:MFS transporter n=1 Tax=Rhodococcus hoagii TaxID=43767 RepID=UPI0009F121D7|nr:MFS transporter [Prescottella equi]OQQ26420.1 MFS transporter [Prescottella equi]
MAQHTSESGSPRVEPAVPTRTPWGQHSLLHAIFFLMGGELFLISPLLPTIAADLGTSIPATALVVTAYGLTYAVASPLLGALAEHVARRRVILAGVAVMVLGEVLCVVAPTLPFLVGARMVGGVGGALMGPAIWAFLAETAVPRERGRAISRGAAAYAGGQIVGVPLGTLVAASLDWRWAIAGVALVLVGVGVSIAVRLREPERTVVRPDGARTALATSFRLWGNRTFRLIMFGNLFAQAARLGTYAFAGALFATRFGLSTETLGFVGALVGIGSFSGSLVAGPLVDRWRAAGRAESVLCIGWGGLLAAALALAVFAPTSWASIVGFMLAFAAGSAFFSTGQVLLTTELAERRAGAVSWNNSAMYVGTAVGTAVLGALGFGTTGFAIGAVVFALAATASSAILSLRRR